MIIKLYNNKSDSRVINKVLENELELNGEINNTYNYATIMLQLDISELSISDYNYMIFDNKCFFVTEINYIAPNTIQIYFSLDVLETFKNDILSQKALIKRSENLFNKYITDNKSVTLNPKRVQTIKFPNEPFTAVSKFILITN